MESFALESERVPAQGRLQPRGDRDEERGVGDGMVLAKSPRTSSVTAVVPVGYSRTYGRRSVAGTAAANSQ